MKLEPEASVVVVVAAEAFFAEKQLAVVKVRVTAGLRDADKNCSSVTYLAQSPFSAVVSTKTL